MERARLEVLEKIEYLSIYRRKRIKFDVLRVLEPNRGRGRGWLTWMEARNVISKARNRNEVKAWLRKGAPLKIGRFTGSSWVTSLGSSARGG